MADPIPLVMTAQGPVPVPSAELLALLISKVAATSPGYTANLPGIMIEDIASTDVAAAQLADSARVELVDSLTPYGANAYLANQLGSVYGVPIGIGSNTSVEVLFSDSSPGFPIKPGFTVGDSSYQYVIQDGGIISEDGTSGLLSAVATQQGSWPVPIDTVTFIATAVPDDVTLNVTNPQAGLPGSSGQLVSDYQAQVLQAGLAASMGMTRYLKTLVKNVPGVQMRLVSARSVIAPQGWPGWEIIVGGGDNTQVANAIWMSLFDISTLTGSVLNVLDVTQNDPAVVTTDLNHGYSTGQVMQINGAVMPGFPNGIDLDATVVSEKEFSIGIDSTGFDPYESGGVCTPNFRNVSIPINDYPDIYQIPFVSPPQQVVTVAMNWNTNLVNFAGDVTIAQLGGPAIVDYVNSIGVGQPLSEFVLQDAFQTAIKTILPPANLIRMSLSISINGVSADPESGTGIILGDPESYFFTTTSSVIVRRG